MLEAFGVTEENWRDATAKVPHFVISETPRFVGRAVAALAADPDRARWNGQSLSSGGLAQVYGFTDLDGSPPRRLALHRRGAGRGQAGRRDRLPMMGRAPRSRHESAGRHEGRSRGIMTATAAGTRAHARQLQGVLLMVLAMLAIPAVDGIAKYLSAGYSPLFIGWARYAAACLFVLPRAFARHGTRLFPSTQRGSHLLRTMLLVTAMTLYFLSIARIPLAIAISTFFVAPILAVMLSIVVLKEELTRWKLASLVLGFAGSLVILRPTRRSSRASCWRSLPVSPSPST